MGKSARGIARDEKLARSTVTKIIREPDVAAYVKGLTEQWYTVGPACLKAVRHALEKELDGNLAHKILTVMGVVPQQPPRGRNPLEIPALTEEEGQRRQAMMAGAALLEGNQQFGVDLPDDFAKKLIESAHTDVVEKKKP
jgi:hypothetical protein